MELMPGVSYAAAATKGTKAVVARLEQAEVARAQREQSNLQQTFFKLPAELRNRVYELVVPRKVWLAFYARFTKRDTSALRICRAIRSEVVPMFYGDNNFAIDMRSVTNASLTWQWLDSLSTDSIAALRKLRVTTIFGCPKCDGRVSVRDIKADSEAGILGLIVTIDRSCEGEPYGVSVDVCGKCEERPMAIAGGLKRVLNAMDLEDDEAVLDRQDLVGLFSVIQSVSPYEIEAGEFSGVL